jgi:diacylglycerol kinase (ATP)
MKVAVIAHAAKTLGGGLSDLRHALAAEGVDDPLWLEVPKAKKAPPQAQRALDEGADVVFVWGGDGMVRRCVDVIAGSDAALAIVPAGTANLFATNMGIPKDVAKAVAIGLRGDRRTLDVGRFAKERFAVMAGVGFDAAMIRDADRLKEKVGRVAYLWSGARNLDGDAFMADIEVDGVEWYKGKASCILLGNVGDIFGGVQVFPDAKPDDGVLELGVVSAQGHVQWARTLARTATGNAEKSPFVRATKARAVKVKMDRKVLYELDGGDRSKVKSFKVKVEPRALTVCVPARAQREEKS